jgi:hypothetical protein
MRLYSNLLSWSPVFWGVEIFFQTFFQDHLPYRKATFSVISEFQILPLWNIFSVFLKFNCQGFDHWNFNAKSTTSELFLKLFYVSRNAYSLHDIKISIFYTVKYNVHFSLPRSTVCLK